MTEERAREEANAAAVYLATLLERDVDAGIAQRLTTAWILAQRGASAIKDALDAAQDPEDKKPWE